MRTPASATSDSSAAPPFSDRPRVSVKTTRVALVRASDSPAALAVLEEEGRLVLLERLRDAPARAPHERRRGVLRARLRAKSSDAKA